MSDVLLTGARVSLVNRRCRDLVRGSAVDFVVDLDLGQVVEVSVTTTRKPLTVTMIGRDGKSTLTQQPDSTLKYDVSVERVAVTEISEERPDTSTKTRVSWPFEVF